MTSDDALRELYATMRTIREFEKLTQEYYRRGRLPGLVHSSEGQEAVAAGVTSVLRDGDKVVSTHRGHGHGLAMGLDSEKLFLEIAGRAGGYCKGKGGSMHISAPAEGFVGANGIVGGGFGIATGMAFAQNYTGTPAVCVIFVGEGAMLQGVAMESMNLAALWRLPLIYVCEYNSYIEWSATEELVAGDLVARAASYGLAAEHVDGMDVVAVRDAAAAAVARARNGDGPSFLEMECFRFDGHHSADNDTDFIPADRREAWRGRDPVLATRASLIARGASEAELESFDAEVRERLTAQLLVALEAPLPTPDEASTDVYAEVAR